jgi:hypothetical protein
MALLAKRTKTILHLELIAAKKGVGNESSSVPRDVNPKTYQRRVMQQRTNDHSFSQWKLMLKNSIIRCADEAHTTSPNNM